MRHWKGAASLDFDFVSGLKREVELLRDWDRTPTQSHILQNRMAGDSDQIKRRVGMKRGKSF